MFRRVTDAEVAHFRANDWVHLPGYVLPEYVRRLHEHILSIESRGAADVNPVFAKKAPFDWRLGDAIRDESPAHAFLSPRNGENAARLLDVQSVRFLKDKWMIKQPQATSGQGPTSYHQDFPALGLDRSKHIVIWISIVAQPAQAGLLRFRSKSHHLGSLGRNYEDEFDIHEKYPALKKLEFSPAWDMQAGDATVHGALMVHGAPANTTSSPRYACGIQYFDAEALFTGAVSTAFEFIRKDLQPNKPVDHPQTPIVYSKALGIVPDWQDESPRPRKLQAG